MKAKLIFALTLGIVGLLVGVRASHAAGTPVLQPLELADVLSMRKFAAHAPLALSADGRQVAYVVSRPSSRLLPSGTRYTETGAPAAYLTSDVWITGIPDGATRNLTGEQGANWAPAWAPDGRTLAFCSDRDGTAGLWLWDRDTEAVRRIGTVVPRATWLEWSPDGKKILIGVVPEGATLLAGSWGGNGPAVREEGTADARGEATVQVFHAGPEAAGDTRSQNIGTGHYASDLALVEVANGAVERIVRGVSPTKTAYSPDGRHIAFGETTGDTVPGSHVLRYTLRLYSLDARRLQTLVPPDQIGRWGADFSWSPDSRTLAYRLGHDYGDVHLVPLSGPSRPATTMTHPPFKGLPVWDQAGQRLLLLTDDAVWTISASDGSAREIARLPDRQLEMFVPTVPNGDRPWLRDGDASAVLVARHGLHKELYRVSLEGGDAQRLFAEQRDYAGGRYYPLASPVTGRIVYIAEDAQHPEDLWITDEAISASTRLTQLNPEISAVEMGALRTIEWTGSDGLPYTGALVLPSGYVPGRRYPLVVHVYPLDDVPSMANKFGSNFLGNDYFNLQLLATRGYAVLYSGAALRPADGEPMRSIANAVLAGIDHVVGLGIVDPERVGVFGMSAGSYSTLALIVQSARFKVAMAQGGPGNLLSLYGDLGNNGYSHGLAVIEASIRMPDHPWKDRDRYIRNSPWFFLDRVQTPLLLIHGTGDTAVIVNQSNELFLGLKRLGKTVQYARYEGEGHTLSSLPNRFDAGQRFLDWFDRYLKPGQEMRAVSGSE